MDLCNPWIRTLRGQSMDCALIVYAYISIAHVSRNAMRIPRMYMACINRLGLGLGLGVRPVVYPYVACIHQLAS